MTRPVKQLLKHPPSSYVDGHFLPVAGDVLVSEDPADPSRIIWQGAPPPEVLDDAIAAARRALDDWSSLSFADRAAFLRRWQQGVKDNAERLAGIITDEMGKTIAESRLEAKAVADKVDIVLDEVSMSRVRGYTVDASATRRGHCRFKPYGVMAVLGPFNFPAHLPNGHFVPALLMGNTVVFKPSKRTPAVGQMLAEIMHETGAPPGVFNVIHGAPGVAAELVGHDGIDGILFTGSWPVGRRILEANLDRPGRIMALEMGGNNPAVVMADANLKQAVIECTRSAFATSGQRCTCTRRVIVQEPVARRFIAALGKVASTLIVGPPRSPEPVFMGPVVSSDAVDEVLSFQSDLAADGGRVIVESTSMDQPGYFVTPGVVEVDGFSLAGDCEVFGPLLQISVVGDLQEAIKQANATRYGLAASIFTTDDDSYERFFRGVNAGCVNRNTGTAGASSKLPFGGLGHSGNHRPAAAFSVDYCAYPVANMVEKSSDASVPTGMVWQEGWV